MPELVKDVMTKNPVTLSADSTVADAAREMRRADVGPIVVLDEKKVFGIVTDRDIVVRAIAEGKDPGSTRLRAICTEDLATLEPDSPLGAAISLMEQKAVRRVPVLENGRPVGIVSLGDLAIERDPRSVLGKISQAPPNN